MKTAIYTFSFLQLHSVWCMQDFSSNINEQGLSEMCQ